MQCAISGEVPREPVVSKKSGQIFEKRLIESHIADHGTEPHTGEELATDDLVALKTTRVVTPRPPTLTSIPSLLKTFQNEWDALALESFTLKQSLNGLEQQLSTALYNYDGAVRVIARVTKERDEARDALSKVSVTERRPAAPGAAPTTNGDAGDAMQVDEPSLPAHIAAKVEETKQSLSATRRKRPVPEGWTTLEQIQSYKPVPAPDRLVPQGSRALAIGGNGKIVLLGGLDGTGCIYSMKKKETLRVIEAGDGPITDAVCLDFEENLRSAVSTSSGAVKIFEGETELASFTTHAGPCTAIALHPSKEILASVGEDKSVVLYDLERRTTLMQRFTSAGLLCCQFHPDGNLLATGADSGAISVFDVTSMTVQAVFELQAPIAAMSFSENGFWLAVATQGSSTVEIWDLRKSIAVHKLDCSSRIDAIEWDYTGQYLAAGGPNIIVVHHYNKTSKSWSQPLKKAAPVTALRWGALAKELAVLTTNGAFGVVK